MSEQINTEVPEIVIASLVTKEAPDFTAVTVMGDNSFNEEFKLSDLRGKYTVLFFYPLDFTFVCPSEIIEFNKAYAKFQAKNCEVVGVSVDSQFSHLAWKNTKVENGGIGQIDYPLVADLTKQISRDYGVLMGDAVALRGLFLIDKDGIVRHSVINDLGLGRNIDEALRMVDALQFTEEHGEVCPANWNDGDEGMTPTADGVAEYLTKHGK
jgi:peroxiredoxin 2/4